MKNIISLTTLLVLTFAFGTAFAWNDDVPYMTNENEYATVLCAKDFGSAGPRIAEASSDDLPALYEQAILGHKIVLAGKGARGVAGGGICNDEVTKSADQDWKFFETVISPLTESDQLL